jgi:hypothetical protein
MKGETMKKITIVLLVLAAFVGITAPAPAQAQVTINSTTLNAAITDTSNTVVISLASIGSGATAVVASNIIFVDGEAMIVKTTPTVNTSVSVSRHQGSTPGQTHLTGAFVYYGPPGAFVSGKTGTQFYSGSCTASNNLFLPVIDIVNGTIGNCQDSIWKWFRLATQTATAAIRHPVVNVAYTALVTDYIIAYTSVSATRAVTLPTATGLAGKVFIIKDESGSATATGTKTITIVGTVDGTSNPTAINTAYGVYRIYSDGTNWFSW